MGNYREVFDLAAKVGSLEGYLYLLPEEAPRYFNNWLGNIDRMYSALPKEVRDDCRDSFLETFGKAVELMDKLPNAGEENVRLAKKILAEARDSS